MQIPSDNTSEETCYTIVDALNMDAVEKFIAATSKENKYNTLNIKKTFKSKNISAEIIRKLCEHLAQTATNITYLVIYNCRFADQGVKILAEELLLKPSKIERLVLIDISVSKAGTEYVFNALQTNKTVNSLMYLQNTVTDELLDKLSKVLTTNQTIEELHLQQNGFTKPACKKFIMSLTTTNVQRLHLRYCGIGNKAAIELANILRNPACKMTHLNLEGNKIGDKGAEAMCTALTDNGSLLVLNLDNNKIAEASAKAITTLMQANPFLVTVTFASNNVPEKYKQPISLLSSDNLKLHKRCNALQKDINHVYEKEETYEHMMNEKMFNMETSLNATVSALTAALQQANSTIAQMRAELNAVKNESAMERFVVNRLVAQVEAMRNSAATKSSSSGNAGVVTDAGIPSNSFQGTLKPSTPNIETVSAKSSVTSMSIPNPGNDKPAPISIQPRAPINIPTPVVVQAPQVAAPVKRAPVSAAVKFEKPTAIIGAAEQDDDLLAFISL